MAIRLQGDALKPFKQFVSEYCSAYESMDVNKLGTIFSLDEAHYVGTGIDKVLTSRDSLLYALQRDFSELATVKMTRTTRHSG